MQPVRRKRKRTIMKLELLNGKSLAVIAKDYYGFIVRMNFSDDILLRNDFDFDTFINEAKRLGFTATGLGNKSQDGLKRFIRIALINNCFGASTTLRGGEYFIDMKHHHSLFRLRNLLSTFKCGSLFIIPYLKCIEIRDSLRDPLTRRCKQYFQYRARYIYDSLKYPGLTNYSIKGHLKAIQEFLKELIYYKKRYKLNLTDIYNEADTLIKELERKFKRNMED